MVILISISFFFNDPATPKIYTTHNTLSLHDALPISPGHVPVAGNLPVFRPQHLGPQREIGRATSELQSLCVISYAVFCLKKKKNVQCKKAITSPTNTDKRKQPPSNNT